MKFLKGLTGGLAVIAIAVATVWAVMAIWHRFPTTETVRMGLCAMMALAGVIGVVTLFTRHRGKGMITFFVAFGATLFWWNTLTPPANRDWARDVARQSYGEISGETLTVHDIRDFNWRSKEDFDENWISKEFDLSQIESTDVFLSYWGPQYMAHLIVSFGFENGDHLAWSVEVRRQKGGGFSPVADMFKANTLAILAATERDIVGLRTNVRGEDVQLYRLRVREEAARRILTGFIEDATDLAAKPRWYNSLFTNCTTVVTKIMDGVGAGQAWDWRVVANGYLPDFAYDIGAVNTDLPLEELRELGRVAPRAIEHGLEPGFSAAIRVGVPVP
ncbi:DUF4105 domain-containing protein [uncultured Pelagimonas sp.]|uniref:Lnb N-terminal periplasmic domain-containing protein n=1 Tax=uncultured Pelagimonas sp. TaxID=1618102 RepID=UPI002606AE64|nr:DUF4105 domain-containing protein [uncultured Pelagimonas sp.]